MKKIMSLLLLTASIPAFATSLATEVEPLALEKLPASSEHFAAICPGLLEDCGPESPLIVWRQAQAQDLFYAVTPQLEVKKIRSVPGGYQQEASWALAQYRHSNADDAYQHDGLTKGGLTLFPAIYQVSKTQRAIALIHSWSSAYDSGEREENYADFIVLEADGTWRTAFRNIPFSSTETIKACFTERDFARNTHCNDEKWRTLKVTIQDTGAEYYTWSFTMKTFHWPSFTAKSDIKIDTWSYNKVPFADQAG
ncbi:hypothetical protein [Mangrovibacter yixingensis]|uniref:hypothetical protein n=1 Tax=Mangrovibacter yixingensis TaxID=1529639 RepID=UPI001CFDBB85|nr:hypothetical protein [Mangrovibacter yixingensis]